MLESRGPFYRGGKRGRGSGSRGGNRGWGGAAHGPLTNKKALGRLVLEIRPELEGTKTTKDLKPVISDCRFLASYNWLDEKDPTILVPGSPPKWTPPQGPSVKLREDSGSYYRDPNAARYSTYPVEPGIRAVLKLHPNYDCPKVDVVACGNTLGSLLSASRLWDDRTFTFGVERVGNTIFLVRQTSPGELIEGVRGYGHSFPDAYTTWPRDVKGSASHQRLIEYTFAGLRIIIRSESDGYLPDKVPSRPESEKGNDGLPEGVSIEEVAETLAIDTSAVTTLNTRLEVCSAGKSIPQEAIFDLKTRSFTANENHKNEFLPRLWANQTPNFVLARHKQGLFQEIKIIDIRDDVQQWERSNEDSLLRLHEVLQKLIQLTGEEGRSRVQVVRVGTGPLQIRETVEKWTVLPRDLKLRWKGANADKEQSDESAEDTDSEDQNEDYLKF